MSIVEGDYVGEIVVIEELAVHFYNLRVITEDVCEVAHNFAMVFYHLGQPLPYPIVVDGGKRDIFAYVLYHCR